MTEQEKEVDLKIAKEVYNATDSLNKALILMLPDTLEAREAYNLFIKDWREANSACYNLANGIIETILAKDEYYGKEKIK